MSADFSSNKRARTTTDQRQPSPSPYSGLRIPPQSIEAEMAVLGSIMLRPETISEIMDFIRPDCFYVDKHRIIYETMLELSNRSSPIDMIAVKNHLSEQGVLDRVGNAPYLMQVLESVPSAANILHYAEIVHKKYMMRRLIEAGDHISQVGYDEALHLNEILDSAQKKMFEVTNMATSAAYSQIEDEIGEAIKRMELRHSPGYEMQGVPSGFKGLDKLLSGFQKSDLIILAARPSVGKTSLALDMMRSAAVANKTPALIFSIEMGAQQLVDRLVAAESGVDAWKMRTGGLRSEEDFKKVGEAASRLAESPIFIDDTPANNILKMRSVARRIKQERGLGIIMVDYLQLMSPVSTKAADSVVQQVTEISRSLKQLAREMQVPVIALSQLSRAVEQRGGEPRLSDLRDSGSIEQDADVVMFIHREMTDSEMGGKKRSDVTKIIIAKHRNGPVGEVELVFSGERTTFSEQVRGDFSEFDNMADPGMPSY